MIMQCGREFGLVTALAAREFHPEMHTVVVISNVCLFERRIVAIRTEMENLVMDLLHVPP